MAKSRLIVRDKNDKQTLVWFVQEPSQEPKEDKPAPQKKSEKK